MKKIILTGILIFSAASLFVSCKKHDSEKDFKFQNNVQELTKPWWKVTDFEASSPIDYDNDGKASRNVYDQMLPCEKDDLVKFNSKGMVKMDQNNLCSGEKANNDGGKWTWADGGNSIKWTYEAGNKKILAISKLNKNSLRFSYTENNNTFTVTMSAR